jgi:hypothetical protein
MKKYTIIILSFFLFFGTSFQTSNKAQVPKENYNIEIKEVLPFEYFQLIKNDSANCQKSPDTMGVQYFIEKFGIEFSKQEDTFLIFPPEIICFWSNRALKADSLCFKSSWRSSYLKYSNHALGKSNPKFLSGGYVLHYKNEKYKKYYFTITLEIRSEKEDPYSVLLIEYYYTLTVRL